MHPSGQTHSGPSATTDRTAEVECDINDVMPGNMDTHCNHPIMQAKSVSPTTLTTQQRAQPWHSCAARNSPSHLATSSACSCATDAHSLMSWSSTPELLLFQFLAPAADVSDAYTFNTKMSRLYNALSGRHSLP